MAEEGRKLTIEDFPEDVREVLSYIRDPLYIEWFERLSEEKKRAVIDRETRSVNGMRSRGSLSEDGSMTIDRSLHE